MKTVDKLIALKKLYEADAITKEELEMEKQKILNTDFITEIPQRETNVADKATPLNYGEKYTRICKIILLIIICVIIIGNIISKTL